MNKRLLVTMLFTFALVCSSSKMYSQKKTYNMIADLEALGFNLDELCLNDKKKKAALPLEIDLTQKNLFQKGITFTQEKLHHITHVTIRDDMKDPKISDEILAPIAKFGGNVQKVSLYNCKKITSKIIRQLLKRCKKLKTIRIINCFIFKKGELTNLQDRYPNLSIVTK